MKAEEILSEALRVVREGGVILYPTDTVWGIGCDACNAAAVARVFEIKRRPDAKCRFIFKATHKRQHYADVCKRLLVIQSVMD